MLALLAPRGGKVWGNFLFLPGAALRYTPGFNMARFQRFEFAPEAGVRTNLGWYRGI